MKQTFHGIAELQLEGKGIERHWAEASRSCVSLTEAIDVGTRRLSQAAKSWQTPYDGVLVLT